MKEASNIFVRVLYELLVKIMNSLLINTRWSSSSIRKRTQINLLKKMIYNLWFVSFARKWYSIQGTLKRVHVNNQPFIEMALEHRASRLQWPWPCNGCPFRWVPLRQAPPRRVPHLHLLSANIQSSETQPAHLCSFLTTRQVGSWCQENPETETESLGRIQQHLRQRLMETINPILILPSEKM